MTIAEKKKKILAYITDKLKLIDTEGKNIEKYKLMLNGMSDTQFDKFMKNMRDGKWQFHLIIPNGTKRPKLTDINTTAKNVGIELYQRIEMPDPATGVRSTTRYKYPILKVPIRRQQQFLDEKMSVPDNDRSIDGMTGQVKGSDKAASITAPEIQALHSKGLKNVLAEVVTVRGGDIANYGEMRRQLEEQGSSRLISLDGTSISRSAKIAEVLLAAMHIDSNMTDRTES